MANDIIARTAIWKGLNRMPYIEDGQLRSMKNLSSDAYPYITTRKGRKEYKLTVYEIDYDGDKDSLPEASESELGKIYKLTEESNGFAVGTFVVCEYNGEEYVWSETAEPKKAQELTFEEYLAKEGITLKKIIEIGQLCGKIAILFSHKSDENETGEEIKLYYEGNLFGEIHNISENSGKKLQTVGNRLVIGESGCYLYYEKTRDESGVVTSSELKLHQAGTSFARTLRASYAEGGWTKTKDSYIHASGKGEIILEFVTEGTKGDGYKEVYEGLMTAGTSFKIQLDGVYYYLQTTEVTYSYNLLIGGATTANEYKWYADVLNIKATGMPIPYEWSCDTGHAKEVLIASTAPHYFDVTAWKKRLWGYEENYVQGTAQDIYDSKGNVDWNRGDNTYMEAIAQPLWQGGYITGIAALADALVVFKEDNLTVITGNYPAIISGSTISCKGLPPENRESVAVINESVYYLSTDGVYRFSGGIPQCISRDIKLSGTEAVGAGDGNKYYISLKEESGEHSLYVYDIALGLWHKEDNTAAVSFTMLGGELYMATKEKIYNLNAPREETEWEMELWYDEGTYNFKKYKGFEVRGNLGECEVFLKADDGEWTAYAFTENKLSISAEPFWCRELSIKIRGKGICEIKTLDRTYEVV